MPRPKKSLGQHWLTDQTVLAAMAAAAEVTPEDTVLEIGPGPGSLTSVLLGLAKDVIAVEIDEAWATELTNKLSNARLQVINQDILTFDLTSLPNDYKVVANIPYYLTGQLVRVISESSNPPQRAVLLVQQEVAERLAAKPGHMSTLSVMAQYYWQVGLGLKVPANLFYPVPKVDSRVVILADYQPPQSLDSRKLFSRLVRAGFSQRRKTLLNSLSAGLHLPREEVSALLIKSEILPTSRAQTLAVSDWQRLATNWPAPS